MTMRTWSVAEEREWNSSSLFVVKHIAGEHDHRFG